MERRFFMNDFEQSLKEHVDQFQMTPSKRVWHGIYNDLHPGRRWPSVTMSLLLIFSLVFIGHLNTNNSQKSAYAPTSISELVIKESNKADKKEIANLENGQINFAENTDSDKKGEFLISENKTNNANIEQISVIKRSESNTVKNEQSPLKNLISDKNIFPGIEENVTERSTQFKTLTSTDNNDKAGNMPDIKQFSHLENEIDLDGIAKNDLNKTKNLKQKEDNKSDQKIKVVNDKLNNEELAAKENNITSVNESDAETRKALLRKQRNDKISWVYFAAPVVSSVSFGGKPITQDPTAITSPSAPVINTNNEVMHHSALGFEAGIQMNYRLTKRLQLTTATHLTYSGYNILSNEVHPTFATLILQDKTGKIYSRSFITHYGDGTGNAVVSLRNYSWQVSIPVGLQYELFGSNKVHFNISGSVEPSMIVKGNGYILSSNGNNYINDESLLRRWNASSNFGAFVTFSSKKFKWNVGPNVRYQWLSTYQRDYPVKEHLVDYGIRIGISK